MRKQYISTAQQYKYSLKIYWYSSTIQVQLTNKHVRLNNKKVQLNNTHSAQQHMYSWTKQAHFKSALLQYSAWDTRNQTIFVNKFNMGCLTNEPLKRSIKTSNNKHIAQYFSFSHFAREVAYSACTLLLPIAEGFFLPAQPYSLIQED